MLSCRGAQDHPGPPRRDEPPVPHLSRRARHAVELRQREIRQRAKKGLATVLRAMEIVLDGTRPADARLADLYRELDETRLREAVATCRDLHDLSDYGYLEALCARHANLKRYLPRFLGLPFRAEPGGADGLLENDTVLRPREHYTDTHGFTEQLFGLCYLLGFSFMPRLRDLKDQQLYRLDRGLSHGVVDGLYRGTVDVALIREQWDSLVRVASSLRSRTAPAHVVLERLAASSDRLAKALTMLGRVVKTTYLLRYLSEASIRDRVQLQLNRGETRHELARRLFFANQGAFRTGDYEEIMNKVSALALLSNAVLVWNTVRISKIVAGLKRASGGPVAPEDLARISPLAHAHVIPSGTYHFERAATSRDQASPLP